MRKTPLFLCIATVLCGLSAGSAWARSAATFKVLASFDYPNASYTYAYRINDLGVIAGGAALAENGRTYGILRSRNGNFTRLITAPNDLNITTILTSVNDSKNFCGIYRVNDHENAFVVIDGVYSEVDLPGSQSNYVRDINNANDYCGDYTYNSGMDMGGYVSIGGQMTTVRIPGDGFTVTSVQGINNLGQAVGYYVETPGTEFGFFRDADGTLTMPISIPGDAETYLSDINDAGWMVGYARRGEHYHGIFFSSPDESSFFMYPGARDTFIYGINNQGLLSGVYDDQNGAEHGFLARVELHP